MTKILIDRAVVEQALEALRCVDLQSLVPDYGSGHYSVARLDGPQVKSAITAMEATLAEPFSPESISTTQAAQQALEALTPFVRGRWTPGLAVQAAAAMDRLKAALAEPQEPDAPARRCGGPGCDGTCCQPVQEPVAWRFETRHIDSAWAAAVTLKHPGPEGVYMRNLMPLYAHPPQRKPLAEWQINDLMADIDPEDRDSWSFRQGVYAAEKHHGVRK